MFEKRARVEATLESEKMNVDEIVRALRENAEWCDANEYEVPLCMGDNQRAAVDLIESLQAQLSTSQRRERAAVEFIKYLDRNYSGYMTEDERFAEWRGRRESEGDNGTN